MYKLIALDMDGTITQHKSPLEPENRGALERLKKKYRIVIVGAGSCERIAKQLRLDGIDIIGNYGMQMARFDEEEKRLVIEQSVTCEVDKASVSERMADFRSKHHLESFRGESVEFHPSGMVTLPLLGTKAELADKLAFDPDRSKRRALYEEVKALYSEYTVFVGGTSSFDMAPAPYNKLYALKAYAKAHEISLSEILYIGDDYGVGGNDEQVYHSDIDFWTIDDYRDFPKLTESL